MPTKLQTSFETELLSRVKELSRDGHRQEVLVALAEMLQHELCVHPAHRQGQSVEYAGELEDIMRAIISVLDKNGRGKNGLAGEYISNRLRGGVQSLAWALESDVPSFKAQEATHQIRLVEIDLD